MLKCKYYYHMLLFCFSYFVHVLNSCFAFTYSKMEFFFNNVIVDSLLFLFLLNYVVNVEWCFNILCKSIYVRIFCVNAFTLRVTIFHNESSRQHKWKNIQTKQMIETTWKIFSTFFPTQWNHCNHHYYSI